MLLVEFDERIPYGLGTAKRLLILKGIPELEIVPNARGKGRPRQHANNADRQRAYRARQKALRK